MAHIHKRYLVLFVHERVAALFSACFTLWMRWRFGILYSYSPRFEIVCQSWSFVFVYDLFFLFPNLLSTRKYAWQQPIPIVHLPALEPSCFPFAKQVSFEHSISSPRRTFLREGKKTSRQLTDTWPDKEFSRSSLLISPLRPERSAASAAAPRFLSATASTDAVLSPRPVVANRRVSHDHIWPFNAIFSTRCQG